MGFAKYQNARRAWFSQRHYEAIAIELNRSFKKYHNLGMDWALEPLEDYVRCLVDMFEMDNINFKPAFFWEKVREDIND